MARSATEAVKAAATGRAEKKAPTIFDLFEDPRVKKALAAVAGKYLTPEAFLRLAINAIKKTPKLLQCDPHSLLGAFMTTAALDLEPNTVRQEAWLIPFENSRKVGAEWVKIMECQFQIGARGFVTLGYRSPLIKKLHAAAVYGGDVFEAEEGSEAFLRHRVGLDKRGPLRASYSFARLENGDMSSIVLPLSEIHKIRARSETWKTLTNRVENAQSDKDKRYNQNKLDDTPWVMWEGEMAAKSATKRHAKILPLHAGDPMQAAAQIDDDADAGIIDMGAMIDPDVVRSVVVDGGDAPRLEDDPSPGVGGEAFGTREQRETIDSETGEVKKTAPAAKKTASAPAPAPAPAAAKDPGGPSFTVAQYLTQVNDAKSKDDAATALDLARSEHGEASKPVQEAFLKKWGV